MYLINIVLFRLLVHKPVLVIVCISSLKRLWMTYLFDVSSCLHVTRNVMIYFTHQ